MDFFCTTDRSSTQSLHSNRSTSPYSSYSIVDFILSLARRRLHHTQPLFGQCVVKVVSVLGVAVVASRSESHGGFSNKQQRRSEWAAAEDYNVGWGDDGVGGDGNDGSGGDDDDGSACDGGYRRWRRGWLKCSC
ncbi:unnamed protein product [Cuscuta europaea]|uniref:Uncharacterized protein n=1 Tax=Cuscuta europaea TaxID=41803 RepID=A0A9P0ZAW2_CUSEU|nr:unnamed protein product [Cuscuta europaea]